MLKRTLTILWAATAMGAVGCGQNVDDVQSTEGAVIGDALPGTNAAAFAAAKANFELTETVQDGAGPIFNERSCSACHSNGATGGAGQNIERRYGRVVNGVFDAMASTGGSLRQLFGLGGFNPSPGLNCQSGTDALPGAGATIRDSGRLTTPLFGLGLVDSLPDSAFDTLASREPAAIRGIVNRVEHRAAQPGRCLAEQRRDARRPLRLEGGRSEPGAVLRRRLPERDGHHHHALHRGRRQPPFATENRANRAPTNAVINGCPDDWCRAPTTTSRPRRTTAPAASTSCRTTSRTSLLHGPPRAAARGGDLAGTAQDRGRTLFNSTALQCSGCHRSDTDIFVSTRAGGIQAGIGFAPYSDFLRPRHGDAGRRHRQRR